MIKKNYQIKAKKTLEKRLYDGKFSFRKCAVRGKKDGRSWRWCFWPPSFWLKWPLFTEKKSPLPPANQKTPSEFEGVLKQVSSITMARCHKLWEEEQTELRKAYQKAKEEEFQAEEKIKEINLKLQEANQEKAKAAEAIKRAESERIDVQKQLEKLPAPEVAKGTMWAILIAGSIVEGLFMIPAFLSEGAVLWQATLGALIAGFFVGACCHVTGKSLKKAKKDLEEIVWIILAGLSLAGYIFVFSIYRTKFVEILSRRLLTEDIVKSSVTFWSFLILIFLILTVIVRYSYLGSSRYPIEWKQLKKTFKRVKKSFKEAQRREVQIYKLILTLQEKKERWEGVRDEARLRCSIIQAEHQGLYKVFLQELKQINTVGRSLIQVYRDENILARPNGELPEWVNSEIRDINYELLDFSPLDEVINPIKKLKKLEEVRI